jgi:GDP-L-fucose synthase
MYPRLAPQPLHPEMLQSGPMEPTNTAYATAKLAGLTLCQAYRRQYGAPFIAGIPANIYGPHDDFRPETGHVIPALIKRMYEATLRWQESLDIWGTGTPRREFIFADDLADGCLFVMNHYDNSEPINMGTGVDYAIADVAEQIAEVVGYRGELRFDPAKPDGMPRKCLDSGYLFGMGWQPATSLRAGLQATFEWFTSNKEAHHVRAAL